VRRAKRHTAEQSGCRKMAGQRSANQCGLQKKMDLLAAQGGLQKNGRLFAVACRGWDERGDGPGHPKSEIKK